MAGGNKAQVIAQRLSCGCVLSTQPDHSVTLKTPDYRFLEIQVWTESSQSGPVKESNPRASWARLTSKSEVSVRVTSASGTTYKGSALLSAYWMGNLASHELGDKYHTHNSKTSQGNTDQEFDGVTMHGYGVLKCSKGEYSGGWQQGVPNGKGKYVSAIHRYTYEGDYTLNTWHGYGTLTFESGHKYVGDFVRDRMEGEGTWTDPDGSQYCGFLRSGMPHGKGIRIYANQEQYEGDWVYGKRVGQGTHKFKNGLTYTGNWVGNKPSGTDFTLSHGGKMDLVVTSKEGNLELKEGQLYLCWSIPYADTFQLTDQISFKGSWISWVNYGDAIFTRQDLDLSEVLTTLKMNTKFDPRFHHRKVLKSLEPKVTSSNYQIVPFEVNLVQPSLVTSGSGTLWSGKIGVTFPILRTKRDKIPLHLTESKFGFHGMGTLADSSQVIYNGQWYMGQMHGTGCFYTSMGCYCGCFYENKIEGVGAALDSRGQGIYYGNFADGLPEGQGAIYQDDHVVCSGVFSKGKLIGSDTQVNIFQNIDPEMSETVSPTLSSPVRSDDSRDEYQTFNVGNVFKVSGNYVNGQLTGIARVVFADGNIWRGYFNGLVPHGYGRFDFKIGNVREGVYQNGDLEGEGIDYYTHDLTWHYGTYKAGSPHGKITILSPDSKTCVDQLFESGSPVSPPVTRPQTTDDWLKIRSRFSDLPNKKVYRPWKEDFILKHPVKDPLICAVEQEEKSKPIEAKPKETVLETKKAINNPLLLGQMTASSVYPVLGGLTYCGQTDPNRGVPQGRGVLTAQGAYVHEGEFADGLPHGRGEERVVWGHTFVGEFDAWQRKTEGSKLVFRNGIIRTQKAAEITFQKLNIVEAKKCVGLMLKDNDHRPLNNPLELEYQTGMAYQGEVDGQRARNGFGILKTPDGYKYEGDWMDDLEHGYGSATYPDGVSYVGDWENGFKSGQGILYLPSGKEFYSGQFHQDFRHGHGVENLGDGSSYEGSFAFSLYSGQGAKVYANNDTYHGEFYRGYRHGHGLFIKHDDYTYDGKFHNDLQSGCATVTRAGNTDVEYWWEGKQVTEAEYKILKTKSG